MSYALYTLGVWRVEDGKQGEFVEAWKHLGHVFRGLAHPPGEGTLVQSLDEPRQYYSFGPWRTLDDVLAMRTNLDGRSELGKLIDLCEESRPGTFRVVATG